MAKILVDDDDFYWDWVKHEDNIFTNRGSFFLIGESMLLAGSAALLSVRDELLSNNLTVFLLAGLFVTIVWLYVNIVHVFVTQRCIKDKLEVLEERWTVVASRRRKWLPNHVLMGIVLPSGLLVVWIALCFL